jgi:copper chaperone
MEKTLLQVNGMSCEHCVAAVKKAATSISGVSKADVDLKSGKVSLEYDSAKAALSAIKAAIEEQGYEVA